MSALSGSTWTGRAGNSNSAKNRSKLYVANRRDTRWYNRRNGRAKRYSKPGTRDLEF